MNSVTGYQELLTSANLGPDSLLAAGSTTCCATGTCDYWFS